MYECNSVSFDDRLIKSFGVELEGIYLIDEDPALESFKKAGFDMHRFSTGTDGSIYSYSRGHNYEIRYWVYNNQNGAEEMAKFFNMAYDISEEFNASCGLHVHFVVEDDDGYYHKMSPLLYGNVRKYLVDKYMNTYLNDELINNIRDRTVFSLVKKIIDTYKEIMLYSDGKVSKQKVEEDYAFLNNINPTNRELLSNNKSFHISLKNLKSQALDSDEYYFDTSDLSDIDMYDRNITKYALRLLSSYARTNLSDCVIYDVSHYNFMNMINSYDDNNNYEFRLMPYADSAKEALEEVAFVVNSITEAYYKFMNFEIDGYSIRDWDVNGSLSPNNFILKKNKRNDMIHTRKKVLVKMQDDTRTYWR
ncbi:MAG: hypothetical protein QXU98_05115 [Candidatus Parvarchaeota archaeon]